MAVSPTLAGQVPKRPGSAGALWIVPPLVVITGVFFYPLMLIARQAMSAEGGALSMRPILDLLGSTAFRRALGNTLTIAAASTAGCLILGLILALVLSFVPFPGARIASRLIDTFIALPTFLVTLAFTFIYGSAGLLNGLFTEQLGFAVPPINFIYSIWGVILAEVTVFTPFIMRPLMAAFSTIDPAQIEVASSLGATSGRIVRKVILPAALPALLAGGSLCLLLTVNEFGIVLFIGAKGVITLPLMIYDKAIQESDYTTACAVALINIALSLLLFGIYRFVLGAFGRARHG